ncbi:MAG TPA: hypothetical protein DD412_00885 [Holosporales bacterium]|nr:hypothetical protein [Holosporales bacterium]
MKIAILCVKEKTAATVFDHLDSFKLFSKNEIKHIDVLKDIINRDILNGFDLIVIHYSVCLFNDDICFPWLRILLRDFTGKKVCFIQDEYRRVDEIVENLIYIKADLLFTCVPESEIEKVYPSCKLPILKKINVLTGYVPKDLLQLPDVPYESRQLDVVYRARKVPTWLGRLGQEKWEVADKFSNDAKKDDLKTDISYHEKDRIYGDDWITFLQNSKATLGCESGASIFDFSGEIQQNVESYEAQHPDAPFSKVQELFFADLENKIKLNQISPRCFEAASLKTLMILYEGDYSGILIPWRHYIPLKKDHSNMEEIVETLSCKKSWQKVVGFAYEEVALNPVYSFEHFISTFDQEVKEITG